MGASEAGQVDGESFDHVYPIEVEGVGGAVRKLQIGCVFGLRAYVGYHTVCLLKRKRHERGVRERTRFFFELTPLLSKSVWFDALFFSSAAAWDARPGHTAVQELRTTLASREVHVHGVQTHAASPAPRALAPTIDIHGARKA